MSFLADLIWVFFSFKKVYLKPIVHRSDMFLFCNTSDASVLIPTEACVGDQSDPSSGYVTPTLGIDCLVCTKPTLIKGSPAHTIN